MHQAPNAGKRSPLFLIGWKNRIFLTSESRLRAGLLSRINFKPLPLVMQSLAKEPDLKTVRKPKYIYSFKNNKNYINSNDSTLLTWMDQTRHFMRLRVHHSYSVLLILQQQQPSISSSSAVSNV